MTASWDNLTPIDDSAQANAPVSWDALVPEDEDKKTYKRPAGDKGWEISATPKEDTTLLGRLGKTLRWVAQTPIFAYMQGEKNVEAAELNAKEIFKPLSADEKNRMNQLENAEHSNFGVPNIKYADENITNLPERAANAIKKGVVESFENLPSSVKALKAGGIGSAVVGTVGAIGGALWGLRKGNPVGGMLEGFSTGVRLGGGAGAARKSFELEAGFARQELKNYKDRDGKPLPDDLVNNASIGVGIANAGLETIGLTAELKTFPGMDKVFKQAKKDFLKEVVENEGLRSQLLAAGKNLIKSTGTEMATESIQQVSNIVAEEYSKKIAGNYDDTIWEDGKINQGALRRHVGEIIQAGVSAIGPSMIIGGVGTSMTATNILIKNGVDAVKAKKLAESMSVDERADLINSNLDTLDEVAKDYITDIEAQDIEKNFFDKAIETYKDKDGNITAEKENQVLSAAKIAGAFAKKFGSNKQQVQDWFNKLSFQNKPLEGGVSMDVQASKEIPFDQLTMEDIPEVQFQKSATFAGTTSKDEALDAVKAWKEQKTESPYFKNWFGDSKVVDTEGKPLVVYHGTDANFDEFDNKKTGGTGFYFAKNINHSVTKNRKIAMPVYLSIKNPAPLDVVKREYNKANGGNPMKVAHDALKNMGYDGFIRDDEIVAFYPEQIKSVYNQGTFDANNSNIYFQEDIALEIGIDENIQNYKKFVEKVFNKKLSKKEKSKLFVIGKTPTKLLEAGISNNDLSISYKIIEKAQSNKNPDHNLSEETIREVYKALHNPVAVIKDGNKTDEKNNNRYAVILDLKNNQKTERGNAEPHLNKPRAGQHTSDNIVEQTKNNINSDYVMVAIEVDKKNDKTAVVNDIRSIHSRADFTPMIEKALDDNRLLKVDKNKLKDLLPLKNFDQFQSGLTSLSSSINENKDNFEVVNFYNLSDKSLERKINVAKRVSDEGGQVLMTERSNSQGAAALSALDANSDGIINDNEQNVNPALFQKEFGNTSEHLEYLNKLENKDKTYYQDKKSLENLHEDIAINKKQKTFEYLGYFKEGQDKNIIGIMQDANPSTIVHEMGHLFLQGLNEFSQTDAEAKTMLKEVNEWLGYTGESYSVDQHEKFARGFEAYLYNGKAPSNTLREVFERFKDWLHSIYNHVDELGVNLTPEIQRIFDNMFSDKKEKQNSVIEMVEKAKFIGLEKLSETEIRHKDAAYHILSVGLGKNKQWLKTILESESESPRILKQKEKIELSLEHVDDKISAADGFLPEWGEFFRNPLQWGEANDYQLVLEAYNTIVDKTYKQNLDQLEFLDRTEQQYQYLLNQYKNAADRDIPLAAFWDWLDTVDIDFVTIYAEKYENDVAYIERFEKMDKFEQAKETILKAAHEAGPYMSSVEKYQEVVKTVMKSIKFLTPNDQAKLTANILDIPSINFLECRIDNILDIAKTMKDVEYKKRLMYSIYKALQFTKNIKQNNKTVGKYDYQTNKIFERMREIEALSAEQANEMRLEIGDAHEEKGLSFEDKIINAFVNYKANGLTFTSTESAKAMYDDIVKMKLAGKEAKSEQDFSAKLNLANDIVEVVKVLDGKTKKASWAENKYLKTFVNWESALNTLFNNKIMKKYSLLKPERDAKVFAWAKKKKFAEGAAKIYGKSVENFDEPIVDNLKQKFEFYENVEDIENPGEFRKVLRTMNKMELILAYMWDKNEVLHQRLLRQFGDKNPDGTFNDLELDRMFGELSANDTRLGDLMMHTVNSIYPKTNEAFIKKYGIDLPRVTNYFPSKVERISEVDLLTDFAMKSTDPSAIKQRSASIGLSQDFGNPVLMMFQHIDTMSKFIHMTETLDKQNKIFKNKTLQKVIEEKYNKPVYQEFLRQLTANTYKQQAQNYCEDQKITDAIISNYLISNISFKPSIAIKQGITAMNYSEVMPAAQWAKGFLKAVKDTKGTIALMNKIPYLQARFETGGQNEFLEDEITNSLFAKTGKIKDALTLNIRAGDIFAIAFGGRPYLEYLMKEEKMSETDAVEEFLNHTQRTMQASETSTLSNYQIKARNERGIASLVTAYRNAQAQYLRKAADAIISYSKGEMTKKQMAKTLFIYMYLNPFMYRSATSLSWVKLLATGDGDDLRDDAILSLFDLNADAHAIWGEIYQFIASVLYKKGMEAATGEKPDYMDFSAKLPLVGDVQDHILKIAKDDVSFEDFFKFGGTVTAYGLGIPANSVYNTIGGVGDIAQGKFLKGALRVQGSSEKRAAEAAGEK